MKIKQAHAEINAKAATVTAANNNNKKRKNGSLDNTSKNKH